MIFIYAGDNDIADKKSPIDIYLGIGGGPEGVLAAVPLHSKNLWKARVQIPNDSYNLSPWRPRIEFHLDSR